MKRAKKQIQNRERLVETRASQNAAGLERYDEDNPQYVSIGEIVVPTQRDKEQLLLALKYLHDCYIDTDFYGVNSLVHLYLDPDKIKVNDGTLLLSGS